MKIQYLSDLHLEGNTPEFLRNFKPIGDVLVLAGDICNVLSKQRVVDFFGNLSIPVIYILGNHEYYRGDWNTIPSEFETYFKNTTITFLNDSFVDIDGVRFIGTTYWSDVSSVDEKDVGNFVNDFRVISNCSVEKQRQAHKKAKEFISFALAQRHACKNVIVSHFPPSYLAQEERFKMSGISSYFYNKDDSFVEQHQPSVWIYGHTHGNLSFDIGQTKVVSNQHGYKSEATQFTFDPNKYIEI